MATSISEIRKKNPNAYNDLSDIELADKIYDKYYQGKLDESEFYQAVFPDIASKRLTEQIIFPDDEFGSNFEFEQTALPFKPTVFEIAKEANVLTNDPATSKARFGASLGYDEGQSILAIKNSLSKLYNQDIDVRKGRTGQLEYFNPEKNQYALVDSTAPDLGDFADIGGDAMVIVPDIIGTIVGFKGGGLAGGTALGALAAGAGEYSRLKLGQSLYGINKDLTDEQLFNEAQKAALTSAAFTIGGSVAANTIKGVNNIIKGRFIKESDIKLLNDSGNADEIAKAVNDTLDKAKINTKLKYTLAQATDDADLLATQEAFENTKRLGFLDEFRSFNRDQAKALNEYFGVLKSGFNTSSSAKPISEFDTGTLIQNVLNKRNQPQIQNLIKKQEQAENLLEKSIFRLPDGNIKVTGAEVRSIIDDLGKTYKVNVDQAAKALDKAADVNLINTDVISKALKTLSEKEKKNLLDIKGVQGIFKPGVFQDLQTQGSKVLLNDVRETLSSLSSKIRDAEIGSVTGESVEVGTLKFLKKAFNEQIKKDAGTDYLTELEKFNNLVITNKQLLNNDIISKLTAIDSNKVLKVANEDIFAQTFKTGIGSGKTAQDVMNVIKESPDALKAYKDSIFKFYKDKVFVDNKPNLKKHNAFINAYESPLKVFFTPQEYTKISRIGGLTKYTEDLEKLRKKTIDDLNKSFEGKLVNASPQELVNKIYKPNNIGEISNLKNILKNDPEVYKAFQRNVLTDMNEKIMKDVDRLGFKSLNSKALDNYINGAGGERGYKNALGIIFDSEFVDNLNTLNRALKIASRKAPARAAEGLYGSIYTDIIRAKVGQFTPLGRALTAVRRFYKTAAERVLANALLNPSSLKELTELRKLKPESERAAIIVSKLGGYIFTDRD
jgi:hypothetical protein